MVNFMSDEKNYKAIEDELNFEKKLMKSVIKTLTDDYSLIVIFDMKKGGDRIVRYIPKMLVKPDEWEPIYTFEQRILYICENHVHPDDQELFRKETSSVRVYNHLENEDTFYFNYRVIDEGNIYKWQVRFNYTDESKEYVIAAFHQINETKDALEPILQTNAIMAKQFACVALINLPRKELNILSTTGSFQNILEKYFKEDELKNEEYLYRNLIKKLVSEDDEKFFNNYGSNIYITHQLKSKVSYQYKVHLKTGEDNNLYRIKYEHLNQNPTYIAFSIMRLENE